MSDETPQTGEPTAEELAELEAAAAAQAQADADAKAEAKAKPADAKPKARASRKRAEAVDEEDQSALHAAAAEVLGIYPTEVSSVDDVSEDIVVTTVDGQRYQLHGSARGEFTWLKQA